MPSPAEYRLAAGSWSGFGDVGVPRRQWKANWVEDRAEAVAFVVGHLRRRLRHEYELVEADTEGQAVFTSAEGWPYTGVKYS